MDRREALLAGLALAGCAHARRLPGARTALEPSAASSASEGHGTDEQPRQAETERGSPRRTATQRPPAVGKAALCDRWPELEALPWRSIIEAPTPIERVPLGDLPLASLLMKQDAKSASGYGGSKPRKLEPLFGAAMAAGVDEVCTFGAQGSNHVAATAVHGRRLGLGVRAYLLPGPLDDHGRRNLELCEQVGATLIPAASQRAAEAQARRWLGKRPGVSVFPWGGTSATGNIGCVAAVLEMARQFERAGWPAPDYIFVAGGTLGTAVGLELGIRAASWPTELVVMRTSNRAPYTQRRFQLELELTRAGLARHAPALADLLKGPAPVIDDSQLGAGYAVPTVAGRKARQWLLARSRFPLDLTYTSKALAGLLAQAPRLVGKRVVFWQTLDPDPSGPADGSAIDSHEFP